jgi:hypothetical protein
MSLVMKLRSLSLVLVFAALSPSLALPQNKQFANSSGQGSDITNFRVIEMSNLGLDDDIVIARIKHSTCHFQLGDADLLDLQRAGVSSKVIAAMLDTVRATSTAPPLVVSSASPAPEPATAPTSAQEKPRVYLVDRDEWKVTGGFAANGTSAAGSIHAGVRRDYTEVLKTFAHTCSQVTFTSDLANADYAVVLDHKSWGETSWSGHMNEYVIFNRAGDLVYSGAKDGMKNAAKDSCKAVLGAFKK